MRNKKLRMSVAFSMLILLMACSSFQNSPNDLEPGESELDEKNHTSNIQGMKMYENVRYGFEILYPESWHIDEESPSGDGVQLFLDEENDIRVFGGVIPPDFENTAIEEKRKAGMNVIEKQNKQGEDGQFIFGEEDDKIFIQYILLQEDQFCSFQAEVTKAFYQENVGVLMEIAESLQF